MTSPNQLSVALLLATCAMLLGSTPARAQQPRQAGGASSSAQAIPFQQSPVQPAFSPLFGPYTPPPAEEPVDVRTVQPFFMTKGGKAQAPGAQSGRFVLTPSIIVDEAYTDNVFLDNDFKRGDFITSFTPGLLLGLRTPDFGLSLGYVFTSEIYVRETQLNDALARWGASVAGFYTLGPQLKLDLTGGYFEDNNTTASGIAGISTGRTRSRGAAVSPVLTWTIDPVTILQAGAGWYTQSFDQDPFVNTTLNNYSTYTFSPLVARRITPTLTGTFQYQYLYQSVDNGDDVQFHLLLPGILYQILPDLSVTLSVGPQITTSQGQTATTLAARLNLAKTFPWGGLGLNFTRNESPVGGIGGAAETNTVGLSAAITNFLVRGLTVSFAPSYTNSVGGGSLGTTDSINLGVLATYPVTRWMVAFLAYDYFRQRTSGTDLNDIDANRVTAGIQLFEALRFK